MSVDPFREPPLRRPSPPAFNVPSVVLAFIAVLVAIHLFRVIVAGPTIQGWMILNLSFIPGCYSDLAEICSVRAPGADLWTPASYTLLHGDGMHIGLNSLWLLAFGTPVARRLGAQRFLVFSIAGSVAGAALFFVINPTLLVPVIGASGAVSAMMGGASRFALGRGDRFAVMRAYRHQPLTPITRALSDRTVLVFVIVFFATNLLFSAGLGGALGEGGIAWEAHLGGFAFGFLGLGLFERRSDGGIAP